MGSLVSAFANDPVLRYLFPDDPTYPRYAAAFFGHLFDKRVHQGTIWTIAHGASVAMWDAPAADDGPPDILVPRRLGHPPRPRRSPLGPRRHGGRIAPRRRGRPAGDPGYQQPGQRRGVPPRRLGGGARRDGRAVDHLDHATVGLLTAC